MSLFKLGYGFLRNDDWVWTLPSSPLLFREKRRRNVFHRTLNGDVWWRVTRRRIVAKVWPIDAWEEEREEHKLTHTLTHVRMKDRSLSRVTTVTINMLVCMARDVTQADASHWKDLKWDASMKVTICQPERVLDHNSQLFMTAASARERERKFQTKILYNTLSQ